VGASLLAMDFNDDACILDVRVVVEFIASRLAPTVVFAMTAGSRSCLRSDCWLPQLFVQ
jgi:hypothetical protein